MENELDQLRVFFNAVEVAYYQAQPWDFKNPQWCEGVKVKAPASETECCGELVSFTYQQVV